MIDDKNNNYLNIKIPEKLEKYLIGLGYLRLRNADVIQLTFSEPYDGKVIRDVFNIDKLDKSLKDLTKKIKLEVPKLNPADLYLIEQEILGVIHILEVSGGENNNIKAQFDQVKIEPEPEVSIIEWLDKLTEKYNFLKSTVEKNFPEIWQTIEFILSVMNILHIKNNTLPFAGFVLGPASSSKTLGLQMLRDLEMTFYTDSFTPRSFVSHNNSVARDKIQEIDLLPKIKNKLFITPELAPIFSNKDDELIQLLGMITRILDGQGFESDSGSLGHRGYSEDIMFTWAGAAVEIPRKVHKHLASLGPKLYFFRMVTKKKTEKEYINDLRFGNFAKSKTEVQEALHDYINWFGYYPLRDKNSQPFKIDFDHSKDDENALSCIVRLAGLLSHLRGFAQTWETRDTQGSDYAYSTPIIEYPTRAQTSLRNLAAGHALIHGRTSITMDDIPIVIKTVLSTAPVERIMIFDLLLNNNGKLSASDIIEFLGTSRPTALRTMTELKVLGLVDLEKESDSDNSPSSITLKNEFRWFLSEEFQELRQGFIPEQFECKEKVTVSESENFNTECETYELKECKEESSPPLTLKKFDDIEVEFDFDSLENIFWKVFDEIERLKEREAFTNRRIIGHIALRNAIIKTSSSDPQRITIEVADRLINKLLKEGKIIELKQGQYYRNDEKNSAETAAAS